MRQYALSKSRNCIKSRLLACAFIFAAWLLQGAPAPAQPSPGGNPSNPANQPTRTARMRVLGQQFQTSLKDQHRDHGLRFPQTSGLHDRFNIRIPTAPLFNNVVLQSEPAPDRTARKDFRFAPGLVPRQTKTEEGKVMGASGWDGWYFTNAGSFPPTRAQNNYLALGSYLSATMSIERSASPEQQMAAAAAQFQSQQQGIANASANGAVKALEQLMPKLNISLINVASEEAGEPFAAGPFRKLSQAVWMIQQLFKTVYLPVSLLFALPGVVLTQFKVTALRGHDADGAAGPLSGLIRAFIAIILIASTQLTVSYAIDIGNSLTGEVMQFTTASEIVDWFQQQVDADAQAAQSQGQSSSAPELDPQPHMAQTLMMLLNGLDMILCDWLLIMVAFQTVLICYLLLLGPLASCFFAWPSEVGTLFRPVYANWASALAHLVMWRFWWAIITLCMTTRISWLIESGQFDPNSEWEMLMSTCFLLMMSYIPFMPFDFRVGDMVDQLLSKCGIDT